MEMKLGKKIVALRRAKGMTQEQLASALGVTAPAVSKWETDTSYPDITLLCPLARALGTNLDTLLQFEESLSEEQLTAEMNRILETARAKDSQTADTMLQKLLHQYPSNMSLKYQAGVVLNTFELFFPLAPMEQREKWRSQKKELLQAVCADKSFQCWQQAAVQLASMLLCEDELEQAEHLLEELPEHTADATMVKTQLYLKQGETEKALKETQKRLYVLVSQVQRCLMQMMGENLQPDAAKALEIGEIYQKTEELFQVGRGMGKGLLVDLYRRVGQEEQAMDSLLCFVDVFAGPVQLPNPLLFSSMIKKENEGTTYSKEMKQMFLEAMRTDESMAVYRENPKFQAAMEKLQESI